MQIDPLCVDGKWVLATDLVNKVNGSSHVVYSALWTFDNTWSDIKPAMTFGTREDAEAYLQIRREQMEEAPFE